MARGSITGRGKNTYRIAVELPTDPCTGRRRQRFETFKGSKRDAEKRLTELLALVDGQQLGANPKMTLAEYLDRWLADYAATKAPKTFAGYKFIAKAYVVPHLGNVQLGKLTPGHVVRLLSILRESPRRDRRIGTGKLSPSTISAAYRMLHTALAVAVKWQLLLRNPSEAVDAPRVPRKEMKTFSPQQAKAFLEASAAEGLRWQCFFTLWLIAGSRPGELRALRWSDLNLPSGLMNIQQNGQRIPGFGRVIGQPKTAGSRRSVALSSEVVALLQKLRIDQCRLPRNSPGVLPNNSPPRRAGLRSSYCVSTSFATVCLPSGRSNGR